ncbi:uncharacterized protein A4U43_C08F13690 [Asparagus officinalis]|nr:uncharacterized protein A4U43_C08F13690 [Asparagus officinalis]
MASPPPKTCQRRRRKPTGHRLRLRRKANFPAPSSGDENILPVKKRLFSGDGRGGVGPLPEHQPKVIRFRCGSISSLQSTTSTPPASDPSPRHDQEAGRRALHASVPLVLQLARNRKKHYISSKQGRLPGARHTTNLEGPWARPADPRTGPAGCERASLDASYASVTLKEEASGRRRRTADRGDGPAAAQKPLNGRDA